MKLEISLNNCFGIGKFKSSFDLSKDNTIMIYAPNGTMKTSLARTFLCLEKNLNAIDLIDETKESSYSFSLDGEKLESSQVYVYKTEDNQIEPNGISRLEEDNILSFNSSPDEVHQFCELLKPIDNLLSLINQVFNKFIKNKNRVFYDETLKVFKHDGILCKYDSVNDAIIHAKPFCAPDSYYDNFFYDELFDEHEVSVKYMKNYHEALVDINKRKNVNVKGKSRWKRLCEIVDSNQCVSERIGDLELLRRDLILAFVSKEMNLFSDFSVLYNERRKELVDIINKVKEDSHLWNQVIYKFNYRFHVPYELRLENRAETILNKETPYIKYTNIDSTGPKEYKGKDHFLNFISTGEKRAYYLLVNLFEIEKRKNSKEKQIIVIDDIAESFDYRNKYAIVEYLAELKECKNLILVILTHNFDFYRTISSRLCLNNIFIAIRDEERNITLKDGQYIRDVFKNVLIRNLNKIDHLISSIPFVRNIVEYTKGIQSYDYKELCRFLHFKEEIRNLTLEQLSDLIYSNVYVEQKREKTSGNYLEALRREADYAYESKDEISIVNKLLLSIAIRLNAEAFAFNKLRLKLDFDIEDIHDYTFTLFEKYRQCFPEKTEESLILTRVTMMTSENIHLNNFMFEPIIDMSSEHLKRLYKEVKSLNGTV